MNQVKIKDLVMQAVKLAAFILPLLGLQDYLGLVDMFAMGADVVIDAIFALIGFVLGVYAYLVERKDTEAAVESKVQNMIAEMRTVK